VLVAMPWPALNMPSIQLGILGPVLERAGFQTEVRSFYLSFMEHCRGAAAGLPPNVQIQLADYDAVADRYSLLGLGDWIFAVPPFRDAPDADVRYVAYLRGQGIPESVVEKALAMRALVPAFLEQCAEDIAAMAPRVVGFTSTFTQNVPSLVLAKLLKERRPATAIIFGGHNCDGPMGAALHRAFPWVDAVVRGEAEEVLPGLVKDLLVGGPVRPQPGLCYRQNGRSVAVPEAGNGTVPLDEIPTPAYDEYFARLAATSFADEIAGDVQLLHETARGCWWGVKSLCTFCGHVGANLAFRSKSPDRVFREITSLASRYGRLNLQAVDDILDLRYFRDLLPRLRDAGYNLDLLFETKANLSREQVHLLKQAGVNWIQPGIESLSTPILKQMRKGVTAFQNIRLLKWCAEYGIQVFWNVLYGFPAEAPEEYARMAALVPSLAHLQAPQFIRLRLDRFSPYHDRPSEWGLEIVGPAPHYRLIYPADEAALADLAYFFEYRHADGRDPETYVGPLRHAIEQWRANEETGYRALRYRRGPGFIVIRDQRPGLEHADYTFDDLEARIYLACEDGATAAGALAALGPAGSENLGVDEVREFLDELVDMRLAYEEGGRYLALALPATPRQQA
jgi:ribosomal peptide maturation radical SAM protein 1